MNDSVPPLPSEGGAPKRRTNGCLIAVVATAVVGVLVFAFGGYYAMMHSGMPLRWFAATVNASDQARVEGLEGSLATGIRFNEFRVFKTGLGDSYVRDFSFKFNGMPDISSSARLIIDEFHIGRIYLSLPTNNAGVGPRNVELENEFNKGMDRQKGGELKRFELKSFRIDEVVLHDATGERNVGSVKLAGLVAEQEGVRLDEFELVSDHIQAQLDNAAETNRFRQAVRGVIRTSIHTNVLRDLDFAIRFGGTTNAGAARVELFAGQLIAAAERDGTSMVRFNDFSPRDWLGGFTVATPSHMSFAVNGNKSGKRSKVNAGSLQLGRVTYEVPEQELDHVRFGGARLHAVTDTGSAKVAVKISHPDDGSGFAYEFSSDNLEGNELLAQALFAKPFAELTDAEREELRAYQGPAATETQPSTPTSSTAP